MPTPNIPLDSSHLQQELWPHSERISKCISYGFHTHPEVPVCCVVCSLKPDVKSGEIPTGADAKDGDVVVVVGKSFETIVLDDTKDVLLEVYAPWCALLQIISTK